VKWPPPILVSLMLASGCGTLEAGQVDRSWSGDLPRSAIEQLPDPRVAEPAGFRLLYGQVETAEAWRSISAALASSRFAGSEGLPEVDWRSEVIVYVAFDGATQRLQWSKLRAAAGRPPVVELTAHPTRRPEAADGPCSGVFQVIPRDSESVGLELQRGTDRVKLATLEILNTRT
jgi:hypothetical protein